MKIILEGSPIDVRAVLCQPDMIFEAAKSDIKADNAAKGYKALTDKLKELSEKNAMLTQAGPKMSDKDKAELSSLRMECGSKTAALASMEAEIQRLRYELSHPVQLTPIQEAELNALFELNMKDLCDPKSFKTLDDPKVEITAEQFIANFLKALATGSRGAAVRVVRQHSRVNLMEMKKLIDNALLRFGCNIDEKGLPITAHRGPIELPAIPTEPAKAA